MESQWLRELVELRDGVQAKLYALGREYRGLKDRRGNEGLAAVFEERRRGIGAAHALRTEIVEGTKWLIRGLLRSHDINCAREEIKKLLSKKQDLLVIEQPKDQALFRVREADNELVECSYFIDLFPVVFFGESVPERFDGPDELCVDPQSFLNGLLDVISELMKCVDDYLLELPDEQFTKDIIMTLKARCVGVIQGLWRFLDEYENTYGMVIDTSRFFPEKFKSKLRRQRDNIMHLRRQLLSLREQELFK